MLNASLFQFSTQIFLFKVLNEVIAVLQEEVSEEKDLEFNLFRADGQHISDNSQLVWILLKSVHDFMMNL